MSSSLNPSLEKLRQAEQVGSARVVVYPGNLHEARSHELVDGHQAVLAAYGIKELKTFNRDWIGNPEVQVIAALSTKTGKVLGGARMYRANTADDLPLYQAVQDQDPKLREFLNPYIAEGAYEIGGLWNSLELAGMGVEALFLVQAAIAALPMLNARHLFALTSPVTRRMQGAIGFQIENEVGAGGYFTYPTDKLRANLARFTFPDHVNAASADVKHLLQEIWQDPEGYVHRVDGPKGQLQLAFEMHVG